MLMRIHDAGDSKELALNLFAISIILDCYTLCCQGFARKVLLKQDEGHPHLGISDAEGHTHLGISDAEVPPPRQQEGCLLVPKHKLAHIDQALEGLALLKLLRAVLGLIAL